MPVKDKHNIDQPDHADGHKKEKDPEAKAKKDKSSKKENVDEAPKKGSDKKKGKK